MRIAIPTNNRIDIAERSGRAKEFAVINIEGKNFEIIEFRKNEHEHHHHNNEGKHEHHGHEDLIETLNDISVVILRMVGKHLKADFDNANIKIVKTDLQNMNEAINVFLENNN